jgi:hypothetical protein
MKNYFLGAGVGVGAGAGTSATPSFFLTRVIKSSVGSLYNKKP